MITILLLAHGAAVEPPIEFRTIDGTENNRGDPFLGSAGTELLRLTTVDYADGAQEPSGADRVSAREISNACTAQESSLLNHARASDVLWQWGQFLDHDLDLTAVIDPPEPFYIPVPTGDPFFDPEAIGNQYIPLERSFYHMVDGIRQQVNEITAYIDASMVYGSDEARALELRTLDGTGRLKTSRGELLPFNTNRFPNAPDSNDPSFFLAGDFRANEQVGLTAMHILFVREHNFWAGVFRSMVPFMRGENIYQLARLMVGAEIQAITYNEFLTVLLGPDALAPYAGYRANVNPGIANIFATAAFRLGHSMLSPVLLRLRRNGKVIRAGNLPLANAFFNPAEIISHGVDPILRGLARQVAQNVDTQVVDGVRNFLFGPPGAGGFDLASLNIQRGRDHGLPSYNQVRVDLGLPPAEGFDEVSSDPDVQANLAAVYPTVEDMDVWVGGLAEDHVDGALVGETFWTILKDQFERLRAGDRFWYENHLPRPMVRLVERQTLAKIIRRNTRIGRELQDNVFIVPTEESDPEASPFLLEPDSLRSWVRRAVRGTGWASSARFVGGCPLARPVSPVAPESRFQRGSVEHFFQPCPLLGEPLLEGTLE